MSANTITITRTPKQTPAASTIDFISECGLCGARIQQTNLVVHLGCCEAEYHVICLMTHVEHERDRSVSGTIEIRTVGCPGCEMKFLLEEFDKRLETVAGLRMSGDVGKRVEGEGDGEAEREEERNDEKVGDERRGGQMSMRESIVGDEMQLDAISVDAQAGDDEAPEEASVSAPPLEGHRTSIRNSRAEIPRNEVVSTTVADQASASALHATSPEARRISIKALLSMNELYDEDDL